VTERNIAIWPFPGQGTSPWWDAYPPHNLPPPRFAVGDRVETRWYTGTVIRVYDCEHFGSRLYTVRGDCSDAPPGFGHRWSEHDMQPARPRAVEPEEDEAPQLAAHPRQASPQLELFA
jgi:hypothetical protein